MLQTIIETHKKKSWLRVCKNNGIDKWDLIDFLRAPVYPSRCLIHQGLEVSTKYCYTCNSRLDVGIYKNTFVVVRKCGCSRIKNHISREKLKCVLNSDQIDLAIEIVTSKRKIGLPNTVDYWIAKGYTKEHAKIEISSVQKSRSSRSPAAKPGAQGYSTRTKAYWMNRGYDEQQAIEQVKKVQITNGIEYYLKKYGDSGAEKYKERIDKWLSAPGNKQMSAGRSKKSIELFQQLGEGFYGPDEKTVRGETTVHRVDFIRGTCIIEYYGDYWHGNPKLYAPDDHVRGKVIQDIWCKDAAKIDDLRKKGYAVLIIWELDYNERPEEIINQCKEFINENHTSNR